jgi:uncharacterized membrane protein YfcA
MAGARLAGKMPEKLLRIAFIAVVAALALKSLVFDVVGQAIPPVRFF